MAYGSSNTCRATADRHLKLPNRIVLPPQCYAGHFGSSGGLAMLAAMCRTSSRLRRSNGGSNRTRSVRWMKINTSRNSSVNRPGLIGGSNLPYRIRCQRSQRTGQRIDVGKKEGVKDECGCGAIDQEIVSFDDGADRTGEDNRCHAAFSHGRGIANCQVNTHVVPPSRDCYPVGHRAPP